MKQIITLFTGIFLLFTARSQVVLNEIYPNPGGGKHEFFELYNNNSSSQAISLKGYCIITYFEVRKGEKGFYVLDLPDLEIASKGYFVGSSANPFNFQLVTGSSKTQFSWNDLAFLNLHNGYLKKWVEGRDVPASIDGNSSYDEKPVPSNFNDFMYRKSGKGTNYSVFIYRNGILINAFFGGSNNRNIPESITDMPNLKVKLAGLGGQFNINFEDISDAYGEYVVSEAGSDNGYMRNKDGLCSSWEKSSSLVEHTPGKTNGSLYGITGEISLWSSITKGTSPLEFSTLNYKVVSAPSYVLPLVLDFYVDNGTKTGELDATDTYLASNNISLVNGTIYQQKFKPYDANILIACKTAAGCFDKVIQASAQKALLPVKLLHFSGNVENMAVKLNWRVTDNEEGKVFEVQKSVDGTHFQTAGFMFASEKTGIEEYEFKGINQIEPTAFYRLKIESSDQSVSYSKVISLRNTTSQAGKSIRLMNNPVESYLGFTYQSGTNSLAEVSIYNMNGTKLYSTRLATQKGANNFTLNLGGRIYAGIYLLEVQNGGDKTVTKFIKK